MTSGPWQSKERKIDFSFFRCFPTEPNTKRCQNFTLMNSDVFWGGQNKVFVFFAVTSIKSRGVELKCLFEIYIYFYRWPSHWHPLKNYTSFSDTLKNNWFSICWNDVHGIWNQFSLVPLQKKTLVGVSVISRHLKKKIFEMGNHVKSWKGVMESEAYKGKFCKIGWIYRKVKLSW